MSARLGLVVFLAGCHAAVVSSHERAVAIVDVTVIPLDSERVLQHRTVIVRGQRIASIEPTGIAPAGATIVDGRGKFLMPGLVDMHTHLARDEDLRLYIARGVTTVRNMWGAPEHVRWRKEIEAGARIGPTIYTAGPIVDGDHPVHDGSLILRTPDEVDAAIRLHRQLGYDFIKVYSGLSQPVYDALLKAAQGAKMPVAGHVPRAVGLDAVVAAGQRSVEHLNGVIDALQADDSPVRGKFDRVSRDQKIDFVDEKKLPALVERLVAAKVWSCPTRTVMDAWDSSEEVRRHLALPEMIYVPVSTRITWEPGPEDPTATARDRKTVALLERFTLALYRAGGHLLVGTDPGNPLVVPGFSVHDELGHLVRMGLSPHAALRIATHDAADYLGAEFGTVAVGQRADLLLLDGNPLVDIGATKRIAGVMARGHWMAATELASILADVAKTVDGREPLGESFAFEAPAFVATFDVLWNGAYFGQERMIVSQAINGTRLLSSRTFDPPNGQSATLRLDTPVGSLVSDGAAGHGEVQFHRMSGGLQLTGTVLSGAAFAPIATKSIDAVEGFVAPYALLALQLSSMSVGERRPLRERMLALGSAVEIREREAEVTRTSKVRYELKPNKGPATVLITDDEGWLREVETKVFGGTLRVVRNDVRRLPGNPPSK